MKKDRIDLFGASSLVAFAMLLGLNQVMVKIVNGGLQPVFQAGLRSLCALPLMILFCILAKKRMSVTDGSFWPGILSGTFFAAEFILLFLALDYTSVARASIFFYTMPFWVAIAAHFMFPGEQLSPIRIFGLILAFVGVVLALVRDEAPVTDQALLGDLFCLLGAMFWAGIALLARGTKLSNSAPQMQLIYQLAVSAPLMLLAALYFGPLIRDLQPYHLMIFSAQVVLIASFGFAFWFWLLSIYPASDVASFGFLSPVFGVFFGWMILDETVSPTLLIALVFVGIGIILINQRRRPKTE